MIKRILAILLLAALLVPTMILATRHIVERVAIAYVNRQLDASADNWKSVFDDFEALFDSSMHRDNVVAILVRVDPTLVGKLPTNDELKDGERCRAAMNKSRTGEYRCGEVVRLFENVPILAPSIPLNFYFVYDQDLRFVEANRPASVEG